MKKISCLVITTLLISCGKSQTIAEKHLEALKSGDTGLAQSQYCAVTDNLRMNNVLDYSILATSEKEREGLPYQEVKVSVTEGLLKEKIEKTYDLEIWNPDNHFEVAKKANQKLAAFGIAPVIKRENWNQGSECLFVPFEENK